MNRKTISFFAISFLAASHLSSPAFADMIEVKGKGVITGQIIKEDTKSVTFKDDYGNQAIYQRSDVTYLEKQAKTVDRSSGPGTSKNEKRSDGSGMVVPTQLSEVPALISSAKEKVSEKMMDYLTEDTESLKDYVKSVVSRPQKIQDDLQRIFNGEKKGMGYGGAAVMMIGLLAAMVFGFKVMLLAFGEDFFWGMVFLGNGLAVFAARMGPYGGLIMLIPRLLSLYFILSHWKLVRKAVVAQFFCFDLVMLGVVMMKMAY